MSNITPLQTLGLFPHLMLDIAMILAQTVVSCATKVNLVHIISFATKVTTWWMIFCCYHCESSTCTTKNNLVHTRLNEMRKTKLRKWFKVFRSSQQIALKILKGILQTLKNSDIEKSKDKLIWRSKLIGIKFVETCISIFTSKPVLIMIQVELKNSM